MKNAWKTYPLFAATLLLAACGEPKDSASSFVVDSSSSATSSTGSSSSRSSMPDKDTEADDEYAAFQKAIRASAAAKGFKAVTRPYELTSKGVSLAEGDDGNETKNNWDLKLTLSSFSRTTTHTGNGDSHNEYNVSEKLRNLGVAPIEYGPGALIRDTSEDIEALNKLIGKGVEDIYQNLYYAGPYYPDRLYYDFDDDAGKSSLGATMAKVAEPAVDSILNMLGYSTYEDDDTSKDTTYHYETKAYLPLTDVSWDKIDNKLPLLQDEASINYLKDVFTNSAFATYLSEHPDVAVSSRKNNVYSFSLSFNDTASFEQCIDDMITLIPEDEKYQDVKTSLTNWSQELKDSGFTLNQFEVNVSYTENALVSSSYALAFQMNESYYQQKYDDAIAKKKTSSSSSEDTSSSSAADTSTDTSPVRIKGVTDFALSSKTAYQTYTMQKGDEDVNTLQSHLADFASLPSKEKLDSSKAYPEQPLSPKKTTSEETNSSSSSQETA